LTMRTTLVVLLAVLALVNAQGERFLLATMQPQQRTNFRCLSLLQPRSS
jgi:hypothetical protein